MTYVLKNLHNGRYVAPAGSEKAYTTKLERARKFATRAQAQADACGDEIVLSLEEACDAR